MTYATKFALAAASALALTGTAPACGGVAVGAATGYGATYARAAFFVPAATYYPVTVGASLAPAPAAPPLVQQQVQYDQPCTCTAAAAAPAYVPVAAAPAYAAGVPVVTYHAPLVFRTGVNYLGGYSYNTHAGFARAFVPARQIVVVRQRGAFGRLAGSVGRLPVQAPVGAGASVSTVLRNGAAISASAPNQVTIRQGVGGRAVIRAR